MRELRLEHGELSVVCVGAHPDDIEIGCGATLLMLAKGRPAAFTHLVMTGTAQRLAEAVQAASLFDGAVVMGHEFADGRLPAVWGDVKSVLEDAAAALPGPDIVFAPRVDDAHQDHRLLGRLVSTTWRDSLILHYEIPKWDGDFGPVSTYVPVPDDVARLKWTYLDSAYSSQHGRDWWDEEMFLSVMRLRGMESRHRYAEGFVVRKSVISLVDDVDSPSGG
jgi:LmbE family N-acetylglucosaminyl deacetylase